MIDTDSKLVHLDAVQEVRKAIMTGDACRVSSAFDHLRSVNPDFAWSHFYPYAAKHGSPEIGKWLLLRSSDWRQDIPLDSLGGIFPRDALDDRMSTSRVRQSATILAVSTGDMNLVRMAIEEHASLISLENALLYAAHTAVERGATDVLSGVKTIAIQKEIDLDLTRILCWGPPLRTWVPWIRDLDPEPPEFDPVVGRIQDPPARVSITLQLEEAEEATAVMHGPNEEEGVREDEEKAEKDSEVDSDWVHVQDEEAVEMLGSEEGGECEWVRVGGSKEEGDDEENMGDESDWVFADS